MSSQRSTRGSRESYGTNHSILYHVCLLVLWLPFCPSPLVLGTALAAACAEPASAIRDNRASNQFFLAHPRPWRLVSQVLPLVLREVRNTVNVF